MYDPRINGWNSKFQYPPTYEDDVEQPLRARVEALEAGGGGGGGGSALRFGRGRQSQPVNVTSAMQMISFDELKLVDVEGKDGCLLLPPGTAYLELKVSGFIGGGDIPEDGDALTLIVGLNLTPTVVGDAFTSFNIPLRKAASGSAPATDSFTLVSNVLAGVTVPDSDVYVVLMAVSSSNVEIVNPTLEIKVLA